MGQRIFEPKIDPFQNFADRRVLASVLWRNDVVVGIVVVRRRDGWSALVEAPERAQMQLVGGLSRHNVQKLWGLLKLSVEWALHELPFGNAPGFSLDPRLNGETPAQCGSLRAFGGEFIGVDIGEFEIPDAVLLN